MDMSRSIEGKISELSAQQSDFERRMEADIAYAGTTPLLNFVESGVRRAVLAGLRIVDNVIS